MNPSLIDGPHNVMGALIFFSYIIVALTISSTILWDLWRLYRARSEMIQRKLKRERSSSLGLQCQGTLALLSFVTLSYHMLNFLIVSYIPWQDRQQSSSLESIITQPSLFAISIWQWATSSTLFQDFGEAICNKPGSYWWTQKALVYSFFWNWYMAETGSRLRVPRLWAYFVLSQILPSSFSQSLFLAACELVLPRVSGNHHKEKNSKKFYLVAMVSTVCYIQCLLAAPTTVGSATFFPILFATRALLFSPCLVVWILGNAGSGKMVGKETLAFVVASLVLLEWWQPGRPKSIIQTVDALNDNHAVSALGDVTSTTRRVETVRGKSLPVFWPPLYHFLSHPIIRESPPQVTNVKLWKLFPRTSEIVLVLPATTPGKRRGFTNITKKRYIESSHCSGIRTITRKLIENSPGKQHLTSSSASPLTASRQDPSSTKHGHHPKWATLLTYTPKARLESHTIPAAHGFAFTPTLNRHFRIIDLQGQQIVDVMAWTLPFSVSNTPTPSSEHFSASYARCRLGGSAPPVIGEGLYSNRDRKMFEIMEDRVECHDMLFMACNPSFSMRMGREGHRSCAGNVAEALNCWRVERDEVQSGKGMGWNGKAVVEAIGEKGHGKKRKLEWHDVHDPFNIFQNTPHYSLKALENSRKGDWIEMKALVEGVVALSNCPYEEEGFNGGKVTDVGVVWEED